MSQHTLTRISNVLEKQFEDRIDMSDWKGRPPDDQRKAFLSRALAALCIKKLADVDADTAGRAVTDGFHDNGVDALYFDQKNDALLIVQSKWSDDGTKPLDADGTATLVAGVRDLLAAKFDRFNERVKQKEKEVRAALYSERPINISIITAHSATQPISAHVKRKVDDLVAELNDPVPVSEQIHYDQAGVYGLITAESQSPKIKLQVALKDWGVIETPFLAYYGKVHIKEALQWWTEHGNALFTQNLRLFYHNSDVNDALSRTLATAPENFWYFNNGITVICDSLVKSPVGAPQRLVGVFTLQGANIVNGAQTVGTIGNSGGLPDTDTDAWVQVRIISLEKCPPDFARAITRAANLQNAVGNREFAAMDPVQHRLATDFALDKMRYAYKQGDGVPKGKEGCDIVEATQALACAHSAMLTVQVKREIGGLWADTTTGPYTDLFNDQLSSATVWRSVSILRVVDEELQKLKETSAYRADLIATHLNRLILHLVFNDSALKPYRHDGADEAACMTVVREATKKAFRLVAEYIEREHPDDYLAVFCKNSVKCDKLVKALLGPTSQALKQGQLF